MEWNLFSSILIVENGIKRNEKNMKCPGRKYINRRLRQRKIRDIEECISVAEFAAKNGISKSSVYYRIATQKIVGFKIFGVWWIKENPRGDEG